jgi:hypothetical protein
MEREYPGSGQVIDEKVVYLNGSFNFPDLSDPLMTQTYRPNDNESVKRQIPSYYYFCLHLQDFGLPPW